MLDLLLQDLAMTCQVCKINKLAIATVTGAIYN